MTHPSLEDLQRYQELFVKPLVEAVQVEMRSHVSTIGAGQAELTTYVKTTLGGVVSRVEKLEGSQRKAMIGWGVFASGLSLAVGGAWGWIKSKVHVS